MAFPSFWEDLRRAFTSEVAIAAAQTELQSEGSATSKQVRLKEIFVVHKVDWGWWRIEQGTHVELRALGGLYSQLSDLQEKGLTTI